MIPGTPENKRMTHPADPISPFRIEHKMGFSPVLHCVFCKQSCDTRKGRAAIAKFRQIHEECKASKQ